MPAPTFPSIKDFAPLSGAGFNARAKSGDPVPVRLIEVNSLGFHTPVERGGRESFSLIFHAPTERRWEQGSYAFSHPQLGEIVIFVVPLGVAEGHMQLQAIFNFS